MTGKVSVNAEASLVFALDLTGGERPIHEEGVQREKGKYVMEVISQQSDNQLQKGEERNAGRQLEREDGSGG